MQPHTTGSRRRRAFATITTVGAATATATATAATAAALLLAACASPLPPLQWVRLPAQLPDQAAGTAPAQPGAAGTQPAAWQLMAPVVLPGHLDRDALLLPSGAAGLQPLAGVRWAEPLRDAVPRLLRDDLARALGSPVWTAPLPPGARPQRQLRVEIGQFELAGDGRSVLLQARWSLADAAGASAPLLGEASVRAPVLPSGPAAAALIPADADALVLAHRRALQLLAQRMAATR